MSGLLQVVVGGQFGSEAKGHVAAHLAGQPWRDGSYAVRVAGPNAGHTVIDKNGRSWPLRSIPVAAVIDPDAQLVLAAGSEVDDLVTSREIRELEQAGYEIENRLMIDPQATVLDAARHQGIEHGHQMRAKIGSTAKGIGAARAERIMRQADLHGGGVDATGPMLQDALAAGARVQIEGTQGYGLGLHAGFYPFCTSSDCRAIDFLAMAGLSPWQAGVKLEVYVTLRPYPIRVAGESGPLHQETTWAQLGLQPEHTTVTKLERRVGQWDPWLAREAVKANGGPPAVRLAVMMTDQVFPQHTGLSGKMPLADLPGGMAQWLQRMQDECGAPIALIGTGPDTMVEVEQ